MNLDQVLSALTLGEELCNVGVTLADAAPPSTWPHTPVAPRVRPGYSFSAGHGSGYQCSPESLAHARTCYGLATAQQPRWCPILGVKRERPTTGICGEMRSALTAHDALTSAYVPHQVVIRTFAWFGTKRPPGQIRPPQPVSGGIGCCCRSPRIRRWPTDGQPRYAAGTSYSWRGAKDGGASTGKLQPRINACARRQGPRSGESSGE
jgi:hypothetical protein